MNREIIVTGTELRFEDDEGTVWGYEGTVVDTGFQGMERQYRVSGDHFHYVDVNGDVRRLPRDVVGSSGAETREAIVRGSVIEYVDESGEQVAAHADEAFSDVPHSDEDHGDTHSNTSHSDVEESVQQFSDEPHSDAGHIDDGFISPDFSDVAHSDVEFSNQFHSNQSHSDGTHSDGSFSDVAHSDEAHANQPTAVT